MGNVTGRLARVVGGWSTGVRRAWDDVVELDERRALLDAPWQEDVLHWSFDGERWHLHGHLLPTGRARSVTRRGWCPGLRDERPQAAPAR